MVAASRAYEVPVVGGHTTQTVGDNTFLAAAVLWNKTASNTTNNANRLDSLFKKSIHVRQNSYFST